MGMLLRACTSTFGLPCQEEDRYQRRANARDLPVRYGEGKRITYGRMHAIVWKLCH